MQIILVIRHEASIHKSNNTLKPITYVHCLQVETIWTSLPVEITLMCITWNTACNFQENKQSVYPT